MRDPNVLDVDETNFEATTLQSPVPVLLDFTAVWCPPCRTIAPHVAALARDYGDRVRVGKVDADSNPQLAARYGIRGLPTLLMFRDGQVVGQLVGAVPRARMDDMVERSLQRASDGAPASPERVSPAARSGG
jgi:thioredoxin 1